MRSLETALLRATLVILMTIQPAAHASDPGELPPYDTSNPIEIPSVGPFYGTRLRGLGGAYTAVAEGAEGTMTSLASLANRRPDEAGYFHWSSTLSWHFPAGDIDVSNTGRVSPAGFNLLAAGGYLRFGRMGLGAFVEGMGMRGGGSELRINRAVVGGAYALPGDEWVVGAGIHSVGFLMRLPDEAPIEGSHPHLGADVLWRPSGEQYRVGASIKLPGWTSLPDNDELGLPKAIVRPWEASMGVALWLGEGALNKPLPTNDEMEPKEPARIGMLLSMDLFVVGPPPGRGERVAGLEAYFRDELQLARRRPSIGIRVGGEAEAIPDRVRIRGGFWLEPSRFHGVRPRLHWTGGLDYLMFSFLGYEWRASMVFDVAPQYRVGGLSMGFW